MKILIVILTFVIFLSLFLKNKYNPNKHTFKSLIIYVVFGIIFDILMFLPLYQIEYFCFFILVFLIFFSLTLSFMN